MATLSKPKHWSSYDSRKGSSALRKAAQSTDPPVERHHSKKPRDFCKPSPDGEHAFAEYLLKWSHITHDGLKRMQFVLSCVYCRQWGLYFLPYRKTVKWVTRNLVSGVTTTE